MESMCATQHARWMKGPSLPTARPLATAQTSEMLLTAITRKVNATS